MKLTAYFTYSGNAKKAAEKVAAAAGADLFEIKTCKPYSSDYKTCIEEAKQEVKSNARPALEGKAADMAAYDTVCLVFPNWCGTCPMPVLSFVEQYDLAGKKIYVFVTHGGGGCGKASEDIAKSAPGAQVAKACDANELTEAQIKEYLGI